MREAGCCRRVDGQSQCVAGIRGDRRIEIHANIGAYGVCIAGGRCVVQVYSNIAS